MEQPFISCIMPTANRPQFLRYAIEYFLKQDYQNSELIILDDGTESSQSFVPEDPRIRYFYTDYIQLLGAKRNFCCEQAKGEIIVHLDDDDWYEKDWISKAVEVLLNYNADITGLNDINFFINGCNEHWEFRDDPDLKPWVYGATLAYRKSFWETNKFDEMNVGEDNEFIWRSGVRIQAHDYLAGYLGILHGQNAGLTPFHNPREKPQVSKWIKGLKQPETAPAHTINPQDLGHVLVSCIMPTKNRAKYVPLAIDYFKKQDYLNKELIIIDDGTQPIKQLIPEDPQIRYVYSEEKNPTVGFKRNIGCEMANGELIIHWDDDDWYATDWISFQVQTYLSAGADICGLNQVQYWSPLLKTGWMLKNSDSHYPWLSGQSLIYRKTFWSEHPFKDQEKESDDDFVRLSGATLFAHNYYQGLLAMLHGHNATRKFFEDPRIKNVN
jgi:glycosyltransferase involved in cell wall biosynthesis